MRSEERSVVSKERKHLCKKEMRYEERGVRSEEPPWTHVVIKLKTNCPNPCLQAKILNVVDIYAKMLSNVKFILEKRLKTH